MSKKLLGETFDIHGGGLDVIFPHHENEIVQSECCHHKPMVLYWAHNGLLRAGTGADKIGGGDAAGKMSRSKGAGGLADLIRRQGGERIRFFLLRTHYRSTVLFNEPAIEEAGIGLESFYRLFKRYNRVTGKDFYDIVPAKTREAGNAAAAKSASDPQLRIAAECRDRFVTAMDHDFNTGGAMGELFELAKITNKFCDEADLEGKGKSNSAAVEQFTSLLAMLKELSSILGIFIAPPLKQQAAGDDLTAKLMPLL